MPKKSPTKKSEYESEENKWKLLRKLALLLRIEPHGYDDNIPSRYVLYDIRSQTGTYLAAGNDPAKGLINDMYDIIDFWPLGSINEKQVYMPVNVMDLKKGISEGTIRTVKDQQKQQEIRNKIMAMEDTDNPVLVVVTLKQ